MKMPIITGPDHLEFNARGSVVSHGTQLKYTMELKMVQPVIWTCFPPTNTVSSSDANALLSVSR